MFNILSSQACVEDYSNKQQTGREQLKLCFVIKMENKIFTVYIVVSEKYLI